MQATLYSNSLGRHVDVTWEAYPTEYAYDPDIMIESVELAQGVVLDASHLSGWVTSELEEQARVWIDEEESNHRETV